MVRGRRGGLVSLIAFVMLLLGGSYLSTDTAEARLHPYYVLQGKSFGQTEPRILFVLDTSGSMTWQANLTYLTCEWNKCEDNNAGQYQSRLNAARTAIREVILATEDQAKFALMTFDQKRPPTAMGSIPKKCKYGNGDYRRFAFFQWFTDGWSWWKPVNPHGFQGFWRLCGENRPYAYLRWDNLGKGQPNFGPVEEGPVPDSPLLATNWNNFYSTYNSKRKVQWFPDFMGIRVNLNDETDPDKVVLDGTYGDYGTNNSGRMNNVWEQDFYYWPYVDGYPGYTYYFEENWYRIGNVNEDTSNNSAALYAPFFLQSAIDNFNPNYAGPKSKEEAKDKILALTDNMYRGGVDAAGGTPWKSVVGPIVAAPPATNGPFSHTTIASYLKFAQNIEQSDLCVPQIAILVTDGDPSPINTEGGSQLHNRLSALRTELNTKVYVVGFFSATFNMNNMACAAAGSNNNASPCFGTPAKDWDTCFDSDNPTTSCAYLANSAEELAETLTAIVQENLEIDVPSGPGSAINDFGQNDGGFGDTDAVQTTIEGHTESSNWRGHVVRALCDDVDPDTLLPEEFCVDQPFDVPEETFGPCPQSRTWDAGECLQQTNWQDRRLYTHDSTNKVVEILDGGAVTPEFLAQLNSPDLALPGAPFSPAQAQAIAGFIAGQNWPEGWKLPGLANSAPVVVRRVPHYKSGVTPSVNIRDPHCAGRLLDDSHLVPTTLEDFAKEAWSEDEKLLVPSPHYAYQEAAIIGDDLGMIHAFQLDSGNELWGFMPRFMLETAVAQYQNGVENMGQPEEIDDHLYGVAATLNHGWVWDEDAESWRHIASMGAGIGGQDYIVFDFSHMSPAHPDGPIEILWTTKDPGLADDYGPLLGETWARPALTYHIPPDDLLSSYPEAFFVMGSGYPDQPATGPEQGRTLLQVDALTGEIMDQATIPAIDGDDVYEPLYGAVVDPAVGTHCVSRFWGEAQEMYWVDPAGRLFRWDLGRGEDHEADSGYEWGDADADPVFTFPACQGEAEFDCDIAPGNKGDPFLYGPAVISNDRIDEEGFASGTMTEEDKDQFMIALVSGSVYDDSIDSGEPDSDYHSSLYLLADDHREDSHEGFSIANGGGETDIGDSSSFFRKALTNIERTRIFTPVPDGPEIIETRNFSRRTRPLRPPRITVTGLMNGEDLVPDVEIMYIEWVVYEPGDQACEEIWYDEDEGTWYVDEGSTYTIRMRLTVKDGEGFDFINGAGVSPDDGVFSAAGLEMAAPEQNRDGDCEDGVCGPQLSTAANKPCLPDNDSVPGSDFMSIATGWSEIDGFAPNEINLP